MGLLAGLVVFLTIARVCEAPARKQIKAARLAKIQELRASYVTKPTTVDDALHNTKCLEEIIFLEDLNKNGRKRD